jgi:CBS domain-containing protein
MNKDLALCNPGNDVRNALKTMAQRQLRRLPVVDESGTLIGMLSLGDIAVRADDALSMDLAGGLRTTAIAAEPRNARRFGPASRRLDRRST